LLENRQVLAPQFAYIRVQSLFLAMGVMTIAET
jgi:hypothetical protein